MSVFSLHNRVALVTGSSTGLGKAMAMCLGKAGAKVAMNYANSQERAESALDEVRKSGAHADLFRADVTSESAIDEMFTSIEASLGSVDIIVVNATPAQPQKPIEEYDWDFYQQMLDFFVKSPYLLARRALPGMKERKHGRLINITSEVFHLGVTPFSAYVAAKGAQTGWSRSMCNELAPHGITVNMIAPGWIPVERHEHDPQEDKDAYLASVPMQRWGTPDDIGWAATYLASDEAAFVTGQTIAVNGGKTCW
ncbi:MAG: SDR family oxidoreductase [Pirellulales bacterium]|nr:SDR family oxidoreductase [Pirellulales bacterium]|tara:strand:- start:784 stop:1542 length:759 start_codon:yes stop_codon:yes gene_type:complete